MPALKGTLHQRKMQNGSFDRPIWGQGQFPSSGASFVQFDVEVPLKRDHRATNARLIANAEEHLRNGRHAEAAAVLKHIVPFNPLAKKLLWECYVAAGDGPGMIAEFYPPETPAEIVHLADALWAAGDRAPARGNARSLQRTGLHRPFSSDCAQKYRVRLTL